MSPTRRIFLSGLGAAALAAARPALASVPNEGRIVTVRGPIEPAEFGPALPHEHVMVDFIGADRVSPTRYDADAVFRTMLPYLQRLHVLGCRGVAECTPAYLGRDPLLLRRLSESSRVHLLTNTGYYNANGGKHLPAHAKTDPVDALAARWIREARDGIGSTGIRPGFVKIGVDAGPLSEVSKRLVDAAALTHQATGLTVAAHTGDGRAAIEQLDRFEAAGVFASAFLWVHAQNEPDSALHLAAAQRGAWVEFDGITPDTIDAHVALVRRLRDAGHLNRVLISHDAGWYHVGEPHGGAIRPFTTLFERFLPALDKAGFSLEERNQLVAENPSKAFVVRPRKA